MSDNSENKSYSIDKFIEKLSECIALNENEVKFLIEKVIQNKIGKRGII
jgi:hypothetical protein